MSYKITKVSESSFFEDDIIKYAIDIASMPVIDPSEAGEEYDGKKKLKELQEKGDKFGLSDEEVKEYRQLVYIYRIAYYENEAKDSIRAAMKDPERRGRYEKMALDYALTKGFHATRGPGIKGPKGLSSMVQETITAAAIGVPIVGQIVGGAIIADRLSSLHLSYYKILKESLKKEDPSLIAKNIANSMEIETKVISNIYKYFGRSHDSSLGKMISDVVEIVLTSIQLAMPGPSGAAVKLSLGAAKNAIVKALLGSLNILKVIISTLFFSELSTPAKFVTLFKAIFSFGKEIFISVLNGQIEDKEKFFASA